MSLVSDMPPKNLSFEYDMSTSLQADMTVEYVLEQWPETAVVFNEFNMVCVGCAVAPFCTMQDAATDYNIPLETLLTRLEKIISPTAA